MTNIDSTNVGLTNIDLTEISNNEIKRVLEESEKNFIQEFKQLKYLFIDVIKSIERLKGQSDCISALKQLLVDKSKDKLAEKPEVTIEQEKCKNEQENCKGENGSILKDDGDILKRYADKLMSNC